MEPRCRSTAFRRAVDTIEMMRVPLRTIALVVSLSVAGAVLTAPPSEARFQGTVVDGDTGEPLEGAVVVVIWYRSAVIALDSSTVIHKAAEWVTGSRGDFSADDSAPLLLFGFKQREVMIFKPGYHKLAKVTHDHRTPLFAESVIRLGKIRTLWDARQRSDTTHFICAPGVGVHDFCVPEARLPKLMRLLTVESRIYEARPPGFTVEEE